MLIGSPIYIVESKEPCWRCPTLQKVIALASTRVSDGEGLDTMNHPEPGELILLKNVEKLDPVLERWVTTCHRHYQRRFSKQAGKQYFANLCADCGANFGDFFLHEVGGAFFPVEPSHAKLMTVIQLPLEGEFELKADWVMGAGDLLWKCAQHS